MGLGERLRDLKERISDPNSLERQSFRGRLGEILGEDMERSFARDELPKFDFKGAWPFPKGDVRSVLINQASEKGEKVFSLALEMDGVTVGIESRSRSTQSFVTLQPGETEEIPGGLSARSTQEAERILLEFGNTIIDLVGARNAVAKEVPSLTAVPLSS